MGNAPVNSFTRDHPEEVSCKWLSPPVAETHKEQHSLAERPANTGSLFMRTSNRRLMFLCLEMGNNKGLTKCLLSTG